MKKLLHIVNFLNYYELKAKKPYPPVDYKFIFFFEGWLWNGYVA